MLVAIARWWRAPQLVRADYERTRQRPKLRIAREKSIPDRNWTSLEICHEPFLLSMLAMGTVSCSAFCAMAVIKPRKIRRCKG